MYIWELLLALTMSSLPSLFMSTTPSEFPLWKVVLVGRSEVLSINAICPVARRGKIAEAANKRQLICNFLIMSSGFENTRLVIKPQNIKLLLLFYSLKCFRTFKAQIPHKY